MNDAFLPGLELARRFYTEAVAPLLHQEYPRLPYAAARIGPGSEVLGFDSARSTDHDWGPRLELFLPRHDLRLREDIDLLLRQRLPKRIAGWPTHFERSPDPHDPVSVMSDTDGPVCHRVTITDVNSFLEQRLHGHHHVATVADWLAMPQQRLAEITGGAVFHDGPGTLTRARRRLDWYPEQVWRYLLACQWQRVAQEEAFVGRCAETGDELGARIIVSRLARDLMRLALLMQRRYAPYGKWLGTAFARLPDADVLGEDLLGALSASSHPAREAALCRAYRTAARWHNRTGVTDPLDIEPRPFHGRGFLVPDAGRFVRALVRTITDPQLTSLPLTGSLDQWCDNTDYIEAGTLLQSRVHNTSR